MNEKLNKNNFCYGCVESKLDGTEHVYNVDDKINIPQEFSWKDVMKPIEDQGQTTMCVTYSICSVLDFMVNSENGTDRKDNGFNKNELYACRANKNAPGMTFKEAQHYLRHNGLNGKKINSYSKINSAAAAKQAILGIGPVVAGLPVYDTYYNDFWKKRGNINGGHAITLVGYSDDKKAFLLRNSWGTSWADNGYVWLPYEDFESSCFECWTIMM